MIKIKDYVRVGSLEEAYELNQKRSACILGGMLWTNLHQNLQNLTMRYYSGRCGAERINSPSGTAAL